MGSPQLQLQLSELLLLLMGAEVLQRASTGEELLLLESKYLNLTRMEDG